MAISILADAREASLEKHAAIWLMNANLRNRGYREVFVAVPIVALGKVPRQQSREGAL